MASQNTAGISPDEMVTWVHLRWHGGENLFWIDFTNPDLHPFSVLGASPIRPLHDNIRAILGRLMNGTWGVEDVERPILAGLIGGDLDIPDDLADSSNPTWAAARRVVNSEVLSKPLALSVPVAQCIVMAAILGVPRTLADEWQTVEGFSAAQSNTVASVDGEAAA